jgi:hypothetical protein
MPELGPYGSMRGETRKSLPYRDFDTLRRANKIRDFRVSGLKVQKRGLSTNGPSVENKVRAVFLKRSRISRHGSVGQVVETPSRRHIREFCG